MTTKEIKQAIATAAWNMDIHKFCAALGFNRNDEYAQEKFLAFQSLAESLNKFDVSTLEKLLPAQTISVKGMPAEIERAALELHQVCSEYSDVKEILRSIKAQTEASIYEAKSNDDKPLYKNDRERAQAVCEALSDSPAYQRNLEIEQQLDARKAMLAAYVERLRGDFSIALIDYEVERLGHRRVA